MKEEGKILKEAGKENPFRVPEGYFEHFTEELMSRLPEKEKTSVHTPTLWEKVRPLVYMAAMFAGAALIIRIASSYYTPADNAMTDEDFDQEMEYINMAMECSMMDDYAMYVYLTDAEQEH